eukprot:GILI01004101.1.p1 GENE.GILI01004101.1~~GILI01004101.1.p1  ORF type:complete len:672 (+),score=129.48 GILI01004101.1:167-2182(+)
MASSLNSMPSTNLRKRSFQSSRVASSPPAASSTPMMGIITSVTIRCHTPSLSLSTSTYVGASGAQLMTPKNYSVGMFSGGQFPPTAYSPTGHNDSSYGGAADRSLTGAAFWRALEAGSPVGGNHASFLSALPQPASNLSAPPSIVPEDFECSASLSNVLGVGLATKPEKDFFHSSIGQVPIACAPVPIYTVLPSPLTPVMGPLSDDTSSPFSGPCTKIGPHEESGASTISSGVDMMSPTRLHPETCDTNTNSSASGKSLIAERSAATEAATSEASTTRELREHAPNVSITYPHLTDYEQMELNGENAIISTVLSSPEEELGVDEASSNRISPASQTSQASVSYTRAMPSNSVSEPHNILPFLPMAHILIPEADQLPIVNANLGWGGLATESNFPFFVDSQQSVASTLAPTPPPAPIKAQQPAVTLREATPADAEGIIALRASLDMTNATSFVWDLEDMRKRIETRYPLIIIALTPDPSSNGASEVVVGVAGIDVHGMEKDFPVRSIGSRLLGVPANTDYVFPADYCMCRGLLIHQQYQGFGLGSMLNKGRLRLLASIAPNAKVILSARGCTIEETLSVVVPCMEAKGTSATPEFTKDELFEFTFSTSVGIVHMVHGKDREGWKFVAVDIADGGPVWLTSKPLAEVVSSYDVNIEVGYALHRHADPNLVPSS